METTLMHLNLFLGYCLITSLLILGLTSKDFSTKPIALLISTIGVLLNSGMRYLYAHSEFVTKKFQLLFIAFLIKQVIQANKYFPYLIGCLICILAVRFLLFRFINPFISKVTLRFFRKELFQRDQRNIDLPYHKFDISDYIKEESLKKHGFFIGLDLKTKKPVYLPVKETTRHIQVLGPSGLGKTESALKPLSLQNTLLSNTTLFIDGKADIQLIKHFSFVFSQCTDHRKFYNFSSLQIEENKELLDVYTTSNTFNPLLSTNDPSKLTDILAIALEMDSTTDAKYYFDTQKNFLLNLFTLFIDIGLPFNFIDIIEFINFPETRKYIYLLAKEKNATYSIESMILFIKSLKDGLPELSGIKVKIDQLFVCDPQISKLINVYESEIDLKKSLNNQDFLLFSLSCGDRYRSNQAIARMVISIINNIVGEKQGVDTKPYWLLIFDEFGQYTTPALIPLISTARNTNTAIALSYQSDALLDEQLAKVVRSNTATKYIFQNHDDADEWAKHMGTIQTFKRSDVVEDDVFFTEKREGKSSNREVDAFYIDPNYFRNLKKGQSIFKYYPEKGKGMDARILNHAMLNFKDETIFKPKHSTIQVEGLNLRELRNKGYIKNKVDSSSKKVVSTPLKKKTEKKASSIKESQKEGYVMGKDF